jgi:hypothetical protein
MSERLKNQQALKAEWDQICPRLLALPAGHARRVAVQALAEEKQREGRKGFSLPTIYRKLEIYQAQGCSQLPYSELFRNKREVLEYHELTVAMVRGWLRAKRKHSTQWCVAHGYRKNALNDLLAGRRGTGDMLDEMVARLAEEMRRDRPGWKRKLAELRARLYRTQKQIDNIRGTLGELDPP